MGKYYKIISLGVLILVLIFSYDKITLKEETQNNGVSLSWNYISSKTPPQTFPGKEDGYQITNITCTNGKGRWDNIEWRGLVLCDGKL